MPARIQTAAVPATLPASSGGAEDRSLRVLLRLLRRSGVSLSRRSRWPSLLGHSVLYALLTAACWLGAYDVAQYGVDAIGRREHWVLAALHSGFFGLTMVLVWLELTLTFASGGRRFAALLDELPELLEERRALAALHRRGWASRPIRARWWVAAALFIAILTSVCIEAAIASSCGVMILDCTAALLSGAGQCVVVTFSQLVPLKYMFVGNLLHDSLRALNSGLAALSDPSSSSACAGGALLARLERLQTRLSRLLALLTAAMAVELVVPTLYGVLVVIEMFMLLMYLLTAPVGVASAVYLVTQTVLIVLLLVGPCETCQRLLSALSASRDHLLRLERRLPYGPDRAAAAWMREAATRDLDTLGDRGRFRLRRATLLSIVSTIVTSMIVMVQFLMTSAPDGAVQSAAGGGDILDIFKR